MELAFIRLWDTRRMVTDLQILRVRLLKEMANLNTLKGVISDAQYNGQFEKLKKQVVNINAQIGFDKTVNDIADDDRGSI